MKEILSAFFYDLCHNVYLQLAVWNCILGYALMYVRYRREKKEWKGRLESLEKAYVDQRWRAAKLQYESHANNGLHLTAKGAGEQ